MKLINILYCQLRQRVFPKEIQIHPPQEHLDEEIILELIGGLVSTETYQEISDVPADESQLIDLKIFLTDLGTSIWRLQKLIDQEDDLKSTQKIKRINRHVEKIADIFSYAGIRIRDHTGEEVPKSGILGLNVITFESREDIDKETVIETIKPTIHLNQDILQIGEVIIGIPGNKEETSDRT